MSVTKYALGITAAIALGSSLAYAGARFDLPFSLTINPDHSGRMTGSLATTRSSSDIINSLGCTVTADSFAGRTSRWVTCQGVTAGSTVLCSSMDPVLVDTAMHISGDSYVSVSWDTSFNCSNIQIQASSFLAPKLP